jgi:hypothetical protein
MTRNTDRPDALLSSREAAKLLNLSTPTLPTWSTPPDFKLRHYRKFRPSSACQAA